MSGQWAVKLKTPSADLSGGSHNKEEKNHDLQKASRDFYYAYLLYITFVVICAVITVFCFAYEI